MNVSSYSDHFPPKTEKYTQKAVDKFGPVSRTLFSDIPLNFAEESNTPRIWSGFFG
jgi:hypothetical protein